MIHLYYYLRYIQNKMAKQQEFMDLFVKYDADADGEIDQQAFTGLITELGVPYQYPGTITKMIRKLNYKNPDKNTLSLEQSKEYYNSFETISKNQIWKAKYSLLNDINQLKNSVAGPPSQGAAPSAAPGAEISKQESDKKHQVAHVNILVGPPQPAYSSEINIQVQKIEKSQKVKPFIKLVFTSTTNARAKQLQIIFKETFNKLVDIFVEESPDEADVAKSIHVNSIVNDVKTTFFITITHEEVIQYIQLLTQFFQQTFEFQLVCKGNLKFQFEYDFQKFITEESSNFYDIFTKTNRTSVDLNLFNLLRALRKLFQLQIKESNYIDAPQTILTTSLLHLEQVEGDFQFQNAESTEYQIQSKEEIKQLLNQLGQFLGKLIGQGIKVREFIDLIDGTISAQVNAGEWKASAYLRLKNINKIFLQYAKNPEGQEYNAA